MPKIVMEAVRAADRDRYLTALYAPADKRDALFALYAFNAEIAGVRDRIHEALPGEVRLQWWRDVIAADSGEAAAGHPLAEALKATIAAYNLPKQAFDNYLEARIFDLYDDPMPSRTDLEGYCGETAGALIQLAAMVLDPDRGAALCRTGGQGRLRPGDHRPAAAFAAAPRARAVLRPGRHSGGGRLVAGRVR